MGEIIARQPNGLLCRYSSIVDDITDYNMTDEEFIRMREKQAADRARDTIEHELRPFSWVTDILNEIMEDEEVDIQTKQNILLTMKNMKEPVTKCEEK